MGGIFIRAMEAVCHLPHFSDLNTWLIILLSFRYIDETIRLDREKFKAHIEQGIPFKQTLSLPPTPSYCRSEPTFQDTADRVDMDDILNALG